MLFGWLIPLIIVIFNLCFEYENYGGDYHCWLQMDTNLIYGQFVPIAFMTIISLAIIEAAGEGAGSKKLQNVDEQQRKTAKIMQRTLVLILPTVRIPKLYIPSTLNITVAHTIDCVCSKMLNHGLNHGLFLSLFKRIPCFIH